MKFFSSLQVKTSVAVVLAGAAALAVWSGLNGRRLDSRMPAPSHISVSETGAAAGSATPQLMSVALAQSQAAPAAAPSSGKVPTEAEKAATEARKPIRVIHDQYSQVSAVAVDVEHDEVVMADENLFQMLVYNRTTNTPASATMSEPKRSIRGPKTFLELQCAVYIDPRNGDIYSLNNDTERHMTVWTRDQSGDEPPAWKLRTPMGSFGIAVDEPANEMLITGQTENVVAAYARTAREEDDPNWVLWGDKTQLADPHGIALDNKKGIFFVTNFGAVQSPRPVKPGEDPLKIATDPSNFIPGSGRFTPVSITVYDKKARNDTSPIRVITGAHTQLDWPTGLFVDSDRGELYVANDGANDVLVFDENASGDAAPVRVLKGSKTQLSYPASVFVDLKNDELWVANFGNHRATVYKRNASGDAAPIREIRTGPSDIAAPSLANVRIGYDTKREQILAANCVAHPQIAVFARTAEGNAQTVRRIEGQKTLLGRTQHSVYYDEFHDEIVMTQAFAGAIMTFRGSANGEEAPIRIIQGPKTGLITDDVAGVDPVHNEYFVPKGPSGPAPGSGYLYVFDRLAEGDVAPKRILGGPTIGLGGIPSIDYEHNLLLISGRGGLYIYDRNAQGDDKPLRIVTGGPKSGFSAPGNATWIPGTRNFIGSASRLGGPGRAAGGPVNVQSAAEARTVIGVWTIDDDGDVAPRFITGTNFFVGLRTIVIDPKHKTLIASDKTANNISSWDFHEAWDPFTPQTAERYVNPRGRGGAGAGAE